MKIQQSTQVMHDSLKKDTMKSSSPTPFNGVMNEAAKELKGSALQRLLHQIEEQGKVLGKEKTLQNLTAYKRLVKHFLEEAVGQGLSLSEKNSMDHRGRNRTYKLVETVEQKLVDLQEEILQKEKSGVHVLSLVGEVKGLLVDLML
ncbi:YaaR family protein [Alkalihalobacillus sp. CinArs1]|uniref:YaaR family protein n=1 Tax=Alkalihalobacillus sp. CinArs1 TaxID=2995314 RepID=UPI0022DD1081|nr:YaaR family protein [Alkalihalobacillus sp. CinArs1]